MNIDLEITVRAKPHIPGQSYKDVEVRVRQRRSGWSVNVLQVWGSCQGCDEEHGRIAVVGFGEELGEAMADAESRATDAEIDLKLLTQAISQVRDAVEEAIEQAEMN